MSHLVLNMASEDSHYTLFYPFASWLSGSQKNPIMDNYMIINLWGNLFPNLNSIMVGFCFEMWNILYKYFILITTISKWQKSLLAIQVIIIHRYYPYSYLILVRYFLIGLPCRTTNLIFLYPSSLQCMARSNPLPVRRFNVAYCHRKLKVRLTEGEKMV